MNDKFKPGGLFVLGATKIVKCSYCDNKGYHAIGECISECPVCNHNFTRISFKQCKKNEEENAADNK